MLLILLFEWFYIHPTLRYGGYSLLALIFFIPISILLENYSIDMKYLTKRINILILIIITVFLTRNIQRLDREYRINNYKANNPYIVDLNGFEIDYQTRFWYLPKLLRGLVFNANYTRTASEVKYPRTVIETKVIFDPSFQVVTLNLDSLYVDRLLDQPKDIIIT